MSYYNVPDDWGQFFYRCDRCGTRYHASEGGCDCREEGPCAHCGDDCDGDDWHEALERFLCSGCACCDYCGKLYKRTEVVEDDGEIICKNCQAG